MMNMVLVTIITVLISGTFYLRERVSNKARDRVARTYEVRVHLNAVADKIKNLELGHYGYLITDDASFLKTYNQELGQESSEATTARSWSAGGTSRGLSSLAIPQAPSSRQASSGNAISTAPTNIIELHAISPGASRLKSIAQSGAPRGAPAPRLFMIA